ncbi:AsnC family transcriptional regulator [Kitasatospora sp. NPDC036755]|uniref:Lrp/AsnC family transcriptional regulator n=1 Tax=Kitasatospora sp. NPDC036755 TaxID=3154600 RepID=UPI0034113F9C
MDQLDRQLLHALYLDGRASFSRIAAVLGVSGPTVARRYRVLRQSGAARVVGSVQASGVGRSVWVLRLACAPGAAPEIAAALARRPDTRWVRIASGGTEVLCNVHADEADRDALLLDKLPATRSVTAIHACCLLHTFTDGGADWAPLSSALSADQVEALAHRPSAVPGAHAPDELDRVLFCELARDGRMPAGELARATGRDESTVRRRIASLRADGILAFDLDVDLRALGRGTAALLWIEVQPKRLAAAGAAFADHPEVAFVAATTGPTSLLASVVTTDESALYGYLTGRLGAVRGVRDVRTTPILRTVKRSGARLPSR